MGRGREEMEPDMQREVGISRKKGSHRWEWEPHQWMGASSGVTQPLLLLRSEEKRRDD